MSDDSTAGVSRRKMLASLAGIGVSSAGAGAGTWAYFQDSESSTGNRVDSGTLTLDLRDGTTGTTWSIENAAPGEGDDTISLSLTNTGSIDADHVEVAFENSDDAGSSESMAEYVQVFNCYYKDHEGNETKFVTVSGGSAAVTDENGNGYVDLDDFIHPNNADALDDLAPPPANGDPTASNGAESAEFHITVAVHEDLHNDFQGATLETDITFVLHQDSDQDL